MRFLSVAIALLPALALADVEARFAKLRDQSESLSSLGSFIDKYAGDCGPAMLGGGDCEKKAELFRRGQTDKKHYMIITEESTAVLSMGEVNLAAGTVVLNLTPFFAGSASAITHGAPSRADDAGNPILPYVRINATIPDGWNPPMMARQVAARALRIQVVFTPQGLWSLPKKGGGQLRGIKARFDAVLVQVARTGEVLGTWYAK